MAWGLDYETFGEVDLPTHGLDNYIKHPSFRPLIAALAYRTPAGHYEALSFDFVNDSHARHNFLQWLDDDPGYIAAHNASFERAVNGVLDVPIAAERIIDTAVISRALGAGSKLEAAAPQLLGVDKLEDGRRLIKKFSVPQPDGYVYVDHVDDWTKADWDDWETFRRYCELDAILSLRIYMNYRYEIPSSEMNFEMLTHRMNEVGWFVDLDLVKQMQNQYQKNLVTIERNFRAKYDQEEKLNFRSTPQLRAWCKERGVNAKSFDELNVAKLISRIEKRLAQMAATPDPSARHAKQRGQYHEVLAMLLTKQQLGGTSLSKLETIQNLTGPDGRLRNQYVHVGAGQTYRTSGRGAQMQNLKRLGSEIGDVWNGVDGWTNDELARNLRQVFMAEDPDGELIVGDFKSVESRGLAYLANARWKLDTFERGRDVYKVLAASMHHVSYDEVTPQQRQIGKVGELACGYGAGPGAVARFAEKMNFPISEEQAAEIVHGWRNANREIVRLWQGLDNLLRQVMALGKNEASMFVGPDDSLRIAITKVETPASLRKQRPDAQSIMMTLHTTDDELLMVRHFQGCFIENDDICYHKPSELKHGKLWHDTWTKDGQTGRYKLYGGKLTGILTQSLCREIFFRVMRRLYPLVDQYPNLKMIGQFHDELVVEWWPLDDEGISLQSAIDIITAEMSYAWPLHKFPLEADVKHAHRYIK